MYKARFFEYRFGGYRMGKKDNIVRFTLDTSGAPMVSIPDLGRAVLKDDVRGYAASMGFKARRFTNEPHLHYSRRETYDFISIGEAHILASTSAGEESEEVRSFLDHAASDMLGRDDAVKATKVARISDIPTRPVKSNLISLPSRPQPQEYPELRASGDEATSPEPVQSSPRVFKSAEFGELAVLMVDGKPCFPATECARMLGYEGPENAVRIYCKSTTQMSVQTNGGPQTKNFISENDLRRLIMCSHLPSAEHFENWIFNEVLPGLHVQPSADAAAPDCEQPGELQTSQVFENSEFGQLNIVMMGDKPYFPATECAKILGYSNPRDAVLRHCKRVVKHDGVSFTVNQHGVETRQIVETNYIPEGDLYRLIIRSKLPSAERFERWVFDEVLPTLRRTGSFTTKPVSLFTPENMAMLSQGYLNEYHKRLALQAELKELQPKIEEHDALMASEDTISFRVMANLIQQNGVAMGQNRLFELLRNVGLLCKSGASYNLPTQRGMNLGIFKVVEVPVFMGPVTQIKKTTRITTKGQQYLFDRIVRDGEWLAEVDLDDDEPLADEEPSSDTKQTGV